MSNTPERKTQAGWGCLVLILAAAFFMTLGQVLLGGHWGWPLVFGALLVYMAVKLKRESEANK